MEPVLVASATGMDKSAGYFPAFFLCVEKVFIL